MIRNFCRCWLLIFILAPVAWAQPLAPLTSVQSTLDVPRAECFPVERLRPDLRRRAEALLRKAMDGEALYTLVGGIKPMSSGWLSFSSDASSANVRELQNLQQIVSCLRCGSDIEAHLYHFARIENGRVHLEGVLIHRRALDAMIEQRQSFWARWAIVPGAHPLETVLATEYAPPPQRSRGYGYLFGYPQGAVDFFVRADQQQELDPQKKLVPRDFLSIPTFDGATHRFVYAVPKDRTPDVEDIVLMAHCAPILAEYRKRRARYIGPNKPGIARLLRDWFDNGRGRCSPDFAWPRNSLPLVPATP